MAGVVLAVLALAGARGLLGRRAVSKLQAIESSSSPPRFHWAPGTSYRYSLAADTEERATAKGGDATADATLDLRGSLVVRCYQANEHDYRLGVSLHDLTRASLRVSGAEGLGDGAQLDGREALLDVNDRGVVSHVWFAKDDPDLFKSVMQTVIPLLQVTLAEDRAELWTVEEPTALGRARVEYASDPVAPRTIRRREASYTKLSALPASASASGALVASDDRVTLRDDGVLGRLELDDAVALPGTLDAKVAADVRFVNASHFTSAPLAIDAYEARAPGELGSQEEMRAQMLRQLAGDMTLRRIEATAFAQTIGGHLPPGFITSAVALLKLEPSYAQAFEEMFERPEASLATRALLLDLLASAGHAKAQEAMRDALSSPTAQRSPTEYGTLLQRMGMLRTPDAKTAAFMLGTYTRAPSSTVKAASAFALGATMGALARGGDPSLLAQCNGRLRADLERARTSDERASVLAGLGNAALKDNVDVIRSYAKDESVQVRRQVAVSLRRAKNPGAEATLFDMLGDSDSDVGLAALESLGQGRVTNDQLQRFADDVGTTAMPGLLSERLLSIVADHLDEQDGAAAVLRKVVASSADPHTQARARMLLGQMGVVD